MLEECSSLVIIACSLQQRQNQTIPKSGKIETCTLKLDLSSTDFIGLVSLKESEKNDTHFCKLKNSLIDNDNKK